MLTGRVNNIKRFLTLHNYGSSGPDTAAGSAKSHGAPIQGMPLFHMLLLFVISGIKTAIVLYRAKTPQRVTKKSSAAEYYIQPALLLYGTCAHTPQTAVPMLHRQRTIVPGMHIYTKPL